MVLLNFDDYRVYLRSYLKKLPHKGRGELSKIAKYLRINTTWLSQILSGAKEFNIDQVIELGTYLDLSPIEIEYFFLLVQYERAGAHKTKSFIKNKIQNLKTESLKLQNQVPHEKKLDDSEKAIFYSSWIYSAIHLFISTQKTGVNLEDVIHEFQIKRTRALEILNFLLKSNLCCKTQEKFKISTQSTFIDRSSPFLHKHHSNWRIKAIEKSENLCDEELMFTAPISISKKDFMEVRDDLVLILKKISTRVQASNPELLANLNIDLFWINQNSPYPHIDNSK
jgi:uncharacterized protein (TIGR02147 family)